MDQRPLFGAGSKAKILPRNHADDVRPLAPLTGQSGAPVQAPVQPVPVQPAPVQDVAGMAQSPSPQPSQTIVPPQQEIPDQQTGSKEDRKECRKRALKSGMIILPGQMMSSYACKIRNESRGGVMLILSDSMLVPSEFYLIRDADPGHKIPCSVAWRGIGRLGAKFIAELTNP